MKRLAREPVPVVASVWCQKQKAKIIIIEKLLPKK
jgi:hypothetical protein